MFHDALVSFAERRAIFMEIHELQQLLSEMSLQEKIGQMVQLTGVYFDKGAVLTGVVGEQLPPEWIIQYAGSVLGVIGKDKIYDIQSRYMEQHPHHIPLLFMADVIHGCRTIYPIPLGQACSFHPELVSEAASAISLFSSSLLTFFRHASTSSIVNGFKR